MTTWFTADTHLGHGRIIKHCNRPFNDHEEMDEAILQRFNEVIQPGDPLYHIGDVSFSTCDLSGFFRRLNTKQVHLILGNHDMKKQRILPHLDRGYFASVGLMKTFSADGAHAMMCHYAMRTWPSRSRGGFQLYGHSHNKLPGIGRQMDVGVDTHDFYPWSWDEIKERMLAVPIYAEAA